MTAAAGAVPRSICCDPATVGIFAGGIGHAPVARPAPFGRGLPEVREDEPAPAAARLGVGPHHREAGLVDAGAGLLRAQRRLGGGHGIRADRGPLDGAIGVDADMIDCSMASTARTLMR